MSVGKTGEEKLGEAVVFVVGLEPLQVAVLLVLDEDGGGAGREELAGVPDVIDAVGGHRAGGVVLEDRRQDLSDPDGGGAHQGDHLEEVGLGLLIAPGGGEEVAHFDAELVGHGLGLCLCLGGRRRRCRLGLLDGFPGFGLGGVAIPETLLLVPAEAEGFQGFPDRLAGLAVKRDFDAVKLGVGGDGVSHGSFLS